jgi:Secretion system C-terminal sorting domain
MFTCITIERKIMKQVYTFTLAFLLTATGFAQVCSGNETIRFKETFGTGNGDASLSAGRTTYNYVSTNYLEDGQYKLNKSTQGRPEWHNTTDHTGDNRGRMMVINASHAAGEFYRDTVSNLSANKMNNVYLYVMNVNTLGTCGSGAQLPRLRFVVEAWNSSSNTFSQVTSFSSSSIPQSANPTWVKIGGSFMLPSNITTVRYIIYNDAPGGCGNDLAIDDITFSDCVAAASLPVTGLKLEAYAKSENIAVNWSTATEYNTSAYIVEKSADGSNWSVAATEKAAGQSNFKTNYAYTDNKAFLGTNYYRIKQVDVDGQYTYSNIVMVKMVKVSAKITVYPNPFISQVNLEMNSINAEVLVVRILNQQGQVVKQNNWNLNAGNNNTTIDNLSNLSKGIYLVDVKKQNGETVYSTKLIK